MLATIALGAAQGMASGAIAGHLVATSLAILGGAFLANYISEKLYTGIDISHGLACGPSGSWHRVAFRVPDSGRYRFFSSLWQ
ncbi:hypothetical protein FXO38_20730 [Capsicum annuum]|uniref:GDT1 family protein n=1 Tax=Capsicum annuum TaxID=4072 RepID=A0A2G2YMU4_CAPAN|nr:hypothetical protein FXO38_20730 [Capsicum annuum]PHT71056.1 hypothetical protein T459_26160 [Capsicum annuum]